MTLEFEIINRYFKKNTNVPLGIGDDAALINKNKREFWAISQDTLNNDTHFSSNTPPVELGWKALAVNVSDIYAMGGKPNYALLSISLNQHNEKWLKGFSQGLHACAKKYGVEIIGGDTTRGATSISITIIGSVFKKNVLKRDAAKVEDDIWVTGKIGLAAIGLDCVKKKIAMKDGLKKTFIEYLNKPQPSNIYSLQAKKLFHSAIDISDGLIADLSHILKSSGVSAEIFSNQLPVHPWTKKNEAYHYALYGGDDYQLILTAAQKNRSQIELLAKQEKIKLTCIGKITNGKKLKVFDTHGIPLKNLNKGFLHFDK